MATPIGNLRDITLRALETLCAADVIAAEDTRVTQNLLRHYGIKKPLIPYHEHNASEARPKILERIQAGATVALVSDAGTPLISDPGYKLVVEALRSGLFVDTLPGASSVLAALSLAGLPTDRFFFEGFLPQKTKARQQRLQALQNIPATLIFFESARRLPQLLDDMLAVFGAREAAVARELTKLYQECVRGSLAELMHDFSQRESIKGEIVVLVAPPSDDDSRATEATLDEALKKAMTAGSLKDAVAMVAHQLNLPKTRVYERALALRDEA